MLLTEVGQRCKEYIPITQPKWEKGSREKWGDERMYTKIFVFLS